jgi:SAM-dependent methyltransferase
MNSAARSCAHEMHEGERLRMPLVRDRHAWLEQLAARTAGEVAHLGCADSPYTDDLLAAGVLLHSKLIRVAQVTGFDLDTAGLETLRRQFPDERFVDSDITAGVAVQDEGRYELVIAGEVLEHVPDADLFLRATVRLLKPGGRLCVTVPNACCPKIGLRSLAGRESVHPDHRVYYGPRTLTRTLWGAGFQTTELASCFAPIAGTAGRLIFNPLLRASHRAFQGPVGDGLIAVASAAPNASAIAS